MADISHGNLASPTPYQGIDAPVGFPQTGGQPALAGLQSWNVTAATAQVVLLPNAASTNNVWVRIDVVTLTAETYAVLASYDGGTTYPEAPVLINASTGALATPATLGVGSYLVAPNAQYSALKFTKSGAVNPGVAAVAWGNQPCA